MGRAEHLKPLDRTRVIIQIGGASATGKEGIGQRIALICGVPMLNTGQIFRSLGAVGWERNLFDVSAGQFRVDSAAEDEIVGWCRNRASRPRFVYQPARFGAPAHVFMGLEDMTNYLEGLYQNRWYRQSIERAASELAAHPRIRTWFDGMCSEAVHEYGGAVLVGRSKRIAGVEPHLSVVFTAHPEVSARYRFSRGAQLSGSILEEMSRICRRDGRDGVNGILDVPGDAVVFDTSDVLLTDGMSKMAGKVLNALQKRYRVQFVSPQR